MKIYIFINNWNILKIKYQIKLFKLKLLIIKINKILKKFNIYNFNKYYLYYNLI